MSLLKEQQPLPAPAPHGSPGGGSVAAFTLHELLVAMGLFSLMVAGVVAAALYGLKMYQATDIKANASDGARTSLNKLALDIREARVARIGSYFSSFTDSPEGSPQQGNALMLHFTTDTNLFVLYYRDSIDQILKRLNSVTGIRERLAHSVTNSLVFFGESHLRTAITNSQNNRAIRIRMGFSQTQYPISAIGPGNLIDYYQLETCVTPRPIE